jgi:hypothetical protein
VSGGRPSCGFEYLPPALISARPICSVARTGVGNGQRVAPPRAHVDRVKARHDASVVMDALTVVPVHRPYPSVIVREQGGGRVESALSSMTNARSATMVRVTGRLSLLGGFTALVTACAAAHPRAEARTGTIPVARSTPSPATPIAQEVSTEPSHACPPDTVWALGCVHARATCGGWDGISCQPADADEGEHAAASQFGRIRAQRRVIRRDRELEHYGIGLASLSAKPATRRTRHHSCIDITA